MNSKITKKEVEDISKLARLDVSDEEKERIAQSFGPIMEMIDQVNSVEIGDEVRRNFRLKNITREDKIKEVSSSDSDKEEIIRSFPEKKDNYLKTKKIL